MPYRLSYSTVRNTERSVIYVVRVDGKSQSLPEINDIATRMHERLHARGEGASDVVVLQEYSKAMPQFFGSPYSVSRVRAAMSNTALDWSPFELE
jgi:hypothetical protein